MKTPDHLIGCFRVKEYLNLIEPIISTEIKEEISNIIDADIIKGAQESYDRHFYYFKKFLNT
jgi:hypothetical protein